MDTRPIGVFDSGLGGLTALRELARLMPEEEREAIPAAFCCHLFDDLVIRLDDVFENLF